MSRRLSYLGNGLVATGALVGAGTVAALAMGYDITLSPAMIHLLAFKGLGAMAAGLIIAGSWIGRKAKQASAQQAPSPSELREGFPQAAAIDARHEGVTQQKESEPK